MTTPAATTGANSPAANPSPSRDVLIALGAIIITPPDAQPSAWHDVATTAGATIDAPVERTVNTQLQHLLDRLGNAGADQNVRDALVRTAKMLPNGGP